MKKILFYLIAICCVYTTVFAHAGGTDSSGGHWDRSSNEYHYHHGHPSHQHVNGSCPYAFSDLTDQNTSTTIEPTASSQSSKSTTLDIPEPVIIAFYLSIPFVGTAVLCYIIALFLCYKKPRNTKVKKK